MLAFFLGQKRQFWDVQKNNIGDTLEENSEEDKLVKKVVESMKERKGKALQEGLVFGCYMKPVSGQVYSVEDIATAKASGEEEKQKAQKMKADK